MPTEEQTYRAGLDKLLEEIRDDGKETKLQTKITNGRVSELEKWQQRVLGFCACVMCLIVPTLFIVIRHFI